MFRQALAIAPDNSLALRDLGLVSLQLGQYADAQSNLEKSAQIQPTFATFSTLAEVLSTEGKYQDAIEMSKKALDLDPTNYVAWGNLASAYIPVPGDRAKAIETYRKAIQLAESARKETPHDPQLLATVGGYYAFLGDADRSAPLLREAVMLAPENPDILFRAGEGYEILHRRGDAIPLIVQSIALGFHSNQLQQLPELASLRADPKFQSALKTALAQKQTGHQP
jgi:tetratricopeptide (TPR) repeat protein